MMKIISILLAILLMGCGKFSDSYDKIGRTCDLAATASEGQHFIRFTSQGQALTLDDLKSVRIGQNDSSNAFTSSGCLMIKDSDEGVIQILHKDQSQAYLKDSKQAVEDFGQTIDLESFAGYRLDPLGPTKVFSPFCPGGKIYTSSSEVPIELNLNYFPAYAGLKLNARLQSKNGSTSQELFSSNLALRQPLSTFSVVLGKAEDLSELEEFSLSLDWRDAFGLIFEGHCSLIFSKALPDLYKVAQKGFMQGFYIELEDLENLDLTMVSSIPMKSVGLSYSPQGSGQQTKKEETYVPFQVNASTWQIIAPKPQLSGPYEVKVTLEDLAGKVRTRNFFVDFGQKFYTTDGAKFAIPSVDERLMLLVGYGGRASVIDIVRDKTLFVFEAGENINFADMNSDGSLIALSLNSKTLVIDTANGKLSEIAIRKGSRLLFTKDGDRVIGMKDGTTLADFEARTGAELSNIYIPDEGIQAWHLTKGSQHLVFSTNHQKIFRLNLDSSSAKASLVTICKRSGAIESLDSSVDASLIAFSCGRDAYLYTQADDTTRIVQSFSSALRAVSLSPDGVWIGMGSEKGDWLISSVKGDQLIPKDAFDALQKKFDFRDAVVKAIVFSKDGRFAAAASGAGGLRVVALVSGFVQQSRQFVGNMEPIGFLNASNRYYSGSRDGGLLLNELPSKERVIKVPQNIDSFYLTNSLIAIGTDFREGKESLDPTFAFLYSLDTGEELLKVDHKLRVNAVGISSDGQWLLSGSQDGRAKLTHTGSHKQSVIFKDPDLASSKAYHAAFFSDSGHRFATISERISSIFDVNDPNKPLQTLGKELLKDNYWLASAAFGDSDRYFTTSASDGKARIYDSQSGRKLAETSGTDVIWSSVISPDGKLFATLDGGGDIFIKSINRNESTGDIVLVDYLNRKAPTPGLKLVFSPDSRFLAYTTWGGRSQIIELYSGGIRDLGCRQDGSKSPPVFDAKSEMVAVGHGNDAVVYKAVDARPLNIVRHESEVKFLGFTKDSLVSAALEGTIKISSLNQAEKANCEK